MKTRTLFTLFQIVAGAGDAATGLLLLVAPSLTLRLMGISRIPGDLIFVSFIGAFVFAVGLSYLVYLRVPRNEIEMGGLRAAWLLTGMERMCVAVFIAIAFAGGKMEGAWMTVSIFDFAFAAFQFRALYRRFPESLL